MTVVFADYLEALLSANTSAATELLVGLFDAIMLTWRWRPGLII